MPLSNRIAKKISNELKLDQDKCEIIAYGAFAFIQIVLSLILVVIFGFLFKVLFEALIISFTASILRKYSGGMHASKPSICLIIGTVVTVGLALLMCYASRYINGASTIIIGFISFAWSYYIIIKYAPVDSKAKPIRTLEKRKRMKKKSIIVLSIYLLIVTILMSYFYFSKNYIYSIYANCIIGAFVWQILNLTIIGHKILNKIDNFLSVILFKRGVTK